jgi:3-dehydroquinate dehydratase/shikimate dehydrogenase
MICVPITAGTTAGVVADLREAAAVADVVELRLDFVRAPDLRAIFGARPDAPATGRRIPLIVTCRAAWEGGRYEGPEDRRLAVLREAAALGADYVDVEAKVERLPDLAPAKTILSRHDFEGTPADLEGLYRSIAARKPDIVKIAATPRTGAELAALARLAARADGPRVVLGMGATGLPTRLLYRRFGCLWTYAALRPGAESASGQLPASQLRDPFRADRCTSGTRVFAVVGVPERIDPLVDCFNRAFAALGVDAICVPLAGVEDLQAVVDAIGIEGTFAPGPADGGEALLRRAAAQWKAWIGSDLPDTALTDWRRMASG